MKLKQLKAIIMLTIVLTLTATITSLEKIKSEFDQLDPANKEMIEYARQKSKQVEDPSLSIWQYQAQLENFQTIPHNKKVHLNILYSSTPSNDLASQPGLDKWIKIQENQPQDVYYAPLIFKIIWVSDTDETVVVARRDQGHMIFAYLDDNSQSYIRDHQFVKFMSNTRTRRTKYAFLLEMMTFFYKQGWHNCNFSDIDFNYKHYGAQFNNQDENITLQDNAINDYYLIFIGFDGLTDITKPCTRQTANAEAQGAYLDMAWLKETEYGEDEYPNVTNSSFGLVLFALESCFISAYLETETTGFSYDEIKYLDRKLNKDAENPNIEKLFQYVIKDNILEDYPVSFKRETRFNYFLSEFPDIDSDSLLAQAIGNVRPIESLTTSVFFNILLYAAATWNSYQIYNFEYSDFEDGLSYLTSVFENASNVEFADSPEDPGILCAELEQNAADFWNVILKLMRYDPSSRISYEEALGQVKIVNEDFDQKVQTFSLVRARDIRRRLRLV